MIHRPDENDRWYEYDYAVLRLVPRVDLEWFINIGVVVHCRTERLLVARIEPPDDIRLATLAPGIDPEVLRRFLDAYRCVADGGRGAGHVGLLPPSERFHWLTAPRSAVIQTSKVHAGRCRDLDSQIELLAKVYTPPKNSSS